MQSPIFPFLAHIVFYGNRTAREHSRSGEIGEISLSRYHMRGIRDVRSLWLLLSARNNPAYLSIHMEVRCRGTSQRRSRRLSPISQRGTRRARLLAYPGKREHFCNPRQYPDCFSVPEGGGGIHLGSSSLSLLFRPNPRAKLRGNLS